MTGMPGLPRAVSIDGRSHARLAMVPILALSVVLTHEATYRLSFPGPGAFDRAMTAGGHDAWWLPLAVTLLVAIAAIAYVTGRELRRLRALVPQTPGTPQADGSDGGPGPGAFLRLVGASWLRLGLLTALAFVVQENVEILLSGQPPVGLDVLGANGLLPLLVIPAISLVLAAVTALVRWQHRALLARLTTRVAHPHPRARASRRPSGVERRADRIPGGGTGSRAPPLVTIVS
jgi:hypothetical protein